jgi:hypothetical protein
MKLPKARRKSLVVNEFSDEVVIYDLESNQAHCLNETSGFVWRHCDGRTSVAKLTKMLGDQMQMSVDEQVVWLALDQLASYDLLQERISLPFGMTKISRRQVVRTLGAAAILAPLVTSIVAPTAAQAASCLPEGSSCTFDGALRLPKLIFRIQNLNVSVLTCSDLEQVH